jgi:Domain of unknown function (DUF1844)
VGNTDPITASAKSRASIPGSGSSAHPYDGIPLPSHGFEILDDLGNTGRAVASAEVISQAAVFLMNASAEKLGMVADGEPILDLDEARRLITALAGLVAASQDFLGIHRQPLRDGVKTLQAAFREASSYPDEPGEGPGEKLIR